MISVVFYIKIPVVLSSIKNTKDFSCFLSGFRFLWLIIVREKSMSYWQFRMRFEGMIWILGSNVSQVYNLQKWHF